jgi:fatty-acyl-CoA synthase
MTEAAGTVCRMPLDRTGIEQKIGASGLIPPDVQVRIADHDERDVPAGEPGKILVRGNNVSAGCWRRPAETAPAFTADTCYRSGEIGSLDQNGFLKVVDREKAMYISDGENVYSAEIEAARVSFPGIAQCAVAGVRDGARPGIASLQHAQKLRPPQTPSSYF